MDESFKEKCIFFLIETNLRNFNIQNLDENRQYRKLKVVQRGTVKPGKLASHNPNEKQEGGKNVYLYSSSEEFKITEESVH